MINSFLETMHSTGADFTNSFRCLSQISLPGSDNHEETLQETKEYLLKQCSTVEEMKKTCQPRMNQRLSQFSIVIYKYMHSAKYYIIERMQAINVVCTGFDTRH